MPCGAFSPAAQLNPQLARVPTSPFPQDMRAKVICDSDFGLFHHYALAFARLEDTLLKQIPMGQVLRIII